MLKTIDSLGPFNKYFLSISCACNMVRETREWTCGMVIVSITDGKLEHAWRRVFTVGDQSEWGACLCWRTSYPPGFYPAFLIPGHGDHSHCLLPTPFAALAETPLRFHVSSDESHWILQPFFSDLLFSRVRRGRSVRRIQLGCKMYGDAGRCKRQNN